MDEPKIKDWYFNKLYIPKVIYTCCFFVASLIALLFLCTVLFEFSLLHPLQFICNSFLLLIDIQSILFIGAISLACLPALLVAIKSLMCSQKRILKIEVLWGAAYIFAHIFSDVLFTFCAINNTKTSIDYSQKLILLFYSLVLSVYFSALYLEKRDYLVKFPKYVIPISRQFFIDLDNILKEWYENLFRIIGFAFVAYSLIGYKIYSFVNFGYISEENIKSLAFENFSIWNLLNLSLICSTLCLTFILYIKRKLNVKLINLYFCRPFEFEMPSPDAYNLLNIHNEPYCPNLADALACQSEEFLKYLAFWDLNRLTFLSKPRLHKLFLVSKPGGHPRPWNSISSQCINLLDEFLSNVQNLNSKLALYWESTFCQKGQILDRPLLAAKMTPENFDPSKFGSETQEKVSLNGKNVRNLEKLLSEMNLFQYFQLHLWTIESLGNILCAAYSDDKFGVVQKDLSKIFGLFSDLITNLERFGRLSGTQYLGQNKRKLINESRLALKEKLAEVLRQLKSTYGQNWRSIELTKEQKETIAKI